MTGLTRSLHVILFLLFSGWLVLFIVSPVKMAPDSYGYFNDSTHLFDPGFHTMRPVLYPLFLRIFSAVPVKMSIVAYLLNCASLLYLVKLSAGTQGLFSRRNTIVLIAFFMLVGIWSYCGTYLTESILFAVVLWIFVFLLKIFFPAKKQPIWMIVLYAMLVCLLATTLKPWIMIMILLSSALLFLAGLTLRSFRSKLPYAAILFVVSVSIFILTLSYNRSKSQEKANMVVLMISSGYEGRLRERLAWDKDSVLLAATLADIGLINHKYNKNPWDASKTNELKLLNFLDKKYAPGIDSAFQTMYFHRFSDVMGLVGLAFERHISQLRFDTSCFEIAYGPEIPGLLHTSVIIIVIFSVGMIIYKKPRRDPSKKELYIFISAILLAGILFSLFLALAGADELPRTVLPAALFQVLALAWIVLTHPVSGRSTYK